MFKKFIQLWKKWILHVSFGFVDQAILSGANFFFNVFLVRWLLPDEYGMYAITFSFFLFLSGFQNALILQPASVIGATYYQNNFSRYLSIITIINGALTIGFSILLILTALIMMLLGSNLAVPFVGLGLATPFILFFWLFRQICYIKTRPDLAWRASFLYTFFLLGSIFILRSTGWMTVFNAFVAIALSNLLVVLFFWRYLGVESIWLHITKDSQLVKKVLIEHWRYGRWVVGSAFANWLSTLSYLPLVGLMVSVQQAGAFRAMQNLMLPVERLLSVFALLLIPWISKNRLSRGDSYLRRRLSMLMVINFSIAGVYGLFLIIYGDQLARLLYGDVYATSFTWILPYFVIISVVTAFVQVLGIGLKILERPDAIFWAESISTMITLSVGLYFVAVFQIRGAALGLLASTIAMLLAMSFFLIKEFDQAKKKRALKEAI